MKQLYMFLLALCAALTSDAQLKADAGADKVWCREYGMSTGPTLGGNPSADQGTPPYTYMWYSLVYSARLFLDTITSSNPTLKKTATPVDSVYFVLEVTDADAKKAYDTVRIYMTNWRCPLGDLVIPKAAQDTVSMRTRPCWSAFWPNVFMHWEPAQYLDDSTKEAARCWTPVSKQYTAYVKDQNGCVNKSFCYVDVASTSIVNLPFSNSEVSVYPNPVTAQSKIVCRADWLGAAFSLFSMDGRLIQRFVLDALETSLEAMSSQCKGVYFYQVISPKGEVRSGRVVFQ